MHKLIKNIISIENVGLLISAVLLVVLTWIGTIHIINQKNFFNYLKKTVVEVVYDDGHGSGVIVGDHIILTARHVVTLGTSPIIKFENGKTVVGHVIWESQPNAYDIALILVDDKINEPIAKLSCKLLKFSQTIYSLGYPLDLQEVITTGVVASNAITDNKGLVIVTNQLAPGMSGGPVFNMSGELVGLNELLYLESVSIFNSPSGLNGITPISEFCKTLIK